MSNTTTTFLSCERTSYDVVTLIVQDASFNTYTTVFNLTDAPFTAPAAPVLTTAGTGGTVLAGAYNVKVSYTDANGETVGSATSTLTTVGTTSTLVIASPAAPSQGTATGYYAYVSSLAAPTVLTRQQTAGSPTAIGTALTLTAPPTTSGLIPNVHATDAPVTNLVRALFAA